MFGVALRKKRDDVAVTQTSPDCLGVITAVAGPSPMLSRSSTLPWISGSSIKPLICSSSLASLTRNAGDSSRRISRNMSSACVMIAIECRSAVGRWLSPGGMKLGATRNRAGLYGNAAGTRPPLPCYAGYLQSLELLFSQGETSSAYTRFWRFPSIFRYFSVKMAGILSCVLRWTGVRTFRSQTWPEF
jgi:hypothetical protein